MLNHIEYTTYVKVKLKILIKTKLKKSKGEIFHKAKFIQSLFYSRRSYLVVNDRHCSVFFYLMSLIFKIKRNITYQL